MHIHKVTNAKDTAKHLEPYYDSAVRDLLGSAREPQSSRVQNAIEAIKQAKLAHEKGRVVDEETSSVEKPLEVEEEV